MDTKKRECFEVISGDRARLEAETVEDLFLGRYDPAKAARLGPCGKLKSIPSVTEEGPNRTQTKGRKARAKALVRGACGKGQHRRNPQPRGTDQIPKSEKQKPAQEKNKSPLAVLPNPSNRHLFSEIAPGDTTVGSIPVGKGRRL